MLADFGTRLLAVLIFGAGAMQLASAAIPSVSEHVEVVRSTLPILAVESSNWFSILSGVLLLGLARGIDGRLRIAYRATQVILLISAALAVTKGLHFGEALFLLALAGLLRTRKRVFTRRAMTLTSATTLGWYTGLVICVLIFFSIGVAQVLGDDSFDLFYFGYGEHTSRIGRGLAAAVLGLGLYLIWQVFAVKRPQLRYPDRAELERARELYQKHGGGEFAHLTFMGDKHLFWAADHQAVIAYGSVRDRLVALGSPCGTDAGIDRAILDFRHFADTQDRKPVFYEVLEPDLSRYHDHGFDLFKLGELALVDLSEFSLAGKRWEDLRQASNRADKEKLTFTLVYPPFDTGLLTNLERVSDAWLADKGGTEKSFSLGSFEPLYLEWSPLALVHRDGELIAFANVLPPYGPGGHASVDLMRHVSDAPRSTMDFLFAKVMQWAKDAGLRSLQPRHGAAVARRRQPVRARQRTPRRARVPLRQSLLQLSRRAPVQGQVQAGMGRRVSGLSARRVAAGVADRHQRAGRGRISQAHRRMIGYLLAVALAAAMAQSPPDGREWFTLSVDGVRTGYAFEERRIDHGIVVERASTTIVVRELGRRARMEYDATLRSDAAGHPIVVRLSTGNRHRPRTMAR